MRRERALEAACTPSAFFSASSNLQGSTWGAWGGEGNGGLAVGGWANGWRGEQGMGMNPDPETKRAFMMHHDVRWVDHGGEGDGKN